MTNPQRLRRIADQVQRELSDIVRLELKDPRVRMVTITAVEIAPDLAHAKIFFTSLADASQRPEILAGLNRASGFLRSMLGARIKIHNTPELHFIYDESIEAGMRLDHLIDEAVASDAALKAPPPRRRRKTAG
jgi:ribosome-binding factor A